MLRPLPVFVVYSYSHPGPLKVPPLSIELELMNGIAIRYSLLYMTTAVMNCLWLAMHLVRSACSRALESAGMRMAIRTAMMPITTSNSASVNARKRLQQGRFIEPPQDVARAENRWKRKTTRYESLLFCKGVTTRSTQFRTFFQSGI